MRPQSSPDASLAQVQGWLAESGQDVERRGDATIHGICLATQRVVPGDLYAALPGTRAHGASYASKAVEAGAVAVLTDRAGAELVPAGVPLLIVERPRAVLGELSARVYARPAEAMRMIGITGTQGKTTTSRIAEGGLQAAGVPAAVIGTIGTRVRGQDVQTSLTTPEAPDLHALFAVMGEQEVDTCLMEVSSHALVLGRVDGVVFDLAVFLNLGRDHLDFHPTVEDYFAAKASLFTPARARRGLVNIDDEFGRRLAETAEIEIRTFGGADSGADWRCVDVVPSAEGSTFTILGPDGTRVRAVCPLAGLYNVSNTLAAVAACAEVGLDPQLVADGIASAPGVPGRLERVDIGQDFLVVVDYAHKPDAVEAALATLRPLTRGRIITVIGAGGDRDPGKRPLMAALAAEGSDVLIITDDNPRTEEPAAIRAAMLAGVAEAGCEVLEVGDRRAAIARAVRLAAPGDIVLIAGKGHETGQEIQGVIHPFDDREVARAELATR